MVCKWILFQPPRTLMCKYENQSILFICFVMREKACLALNFDDVIDLKYAWNLKNIDQIKSQHSTQYRYAMEKKLKFEAAMFIVLNISFCACLFWGQYITIRIFNFKNSLSSCRNLLKSGRMLTVFHYLYLNRFQHGKYCSFHQKKKCIELFNFVSKTTNILQVGLFELNSVETVSEHTRLYSCEYLIWILLKSLQIPMK